jgi:hypothetical protein
MKGNHRRLMPFHYQEVQAIRQRELSDLFLEFLKALGGYGERRRQQRGS